MRTRVSLCYNYISVLADADVAEEATLLSRRLAIPPAPTLDSDLSIGRFVGSALVLRLARFREVGGCCPEVIVATGAGS